MLSKLKEYIKPNEIMYVNKRKNNIKLKFEFKISILIRQ